MRLLEPSEVLLVDGGIEETKVNVVEDCDMPVVLLCGGKGRRLRPKTEETPKPLLRIGRKPMVWHIMENFAEHGFRNFVLCLGYKSEAFFEYFRTQVPKHAVADSVLLSPAHEIIDIRVQDMDITLVDTGVETSISDRLRQVQKHIDSDRFFMTYGDALADVDIQQLLQRHGEGDKIATVTGVQAQNPYGVLRTNGNTVEAIEEKPLMSQRINGGFFVYEASVFDYFSDDKDFVQTLNGLAADGELGIYHHDGFFKGIDTHKDLSQIRDLATEVGKRPWMHGAR